MARVMGEMQHSGIESLMALREPPVQGRRHKIVTQAEAAGLVEGALDQRGLNYTANYATSGSRMINGEQYTQTILAARYIFDDLTADSGHQACLNMLHSTGQEVGWIFDPALNTTVCTNLHAAGEWNLARRKHTTGLRAPAYAAYVVEAFLQSINALEATTVRLAQASVTKTQTAAVTLGLFRSGTLPVRMLKPVCETLFDAPDDEVPEIAATRGSLMAVGHAATRVLRDEPSRRQAEMSGAVTQRLLVAAA